MMLIGDVYHTIDPKGRYIVPARFREALGDKFYITRGLDNCLFVYSAEAWQVRLQALERLSVTKASQRRFLRKFLKGATEVEVDKQGRVLIPPSLREHAQLERDIITMGMSDRLEIWSEAVWQKYDDDADDDYETLAEELALDDFRL